MKATMEIDEPAKVNVTLTITMTGRQWLDLSGVLESDAVRLQNTEMYSQKHMAVDELHNAIKDLCSQLRKTFWAKQ